MKTESPKVTLLEATVQHTAQFPASSWSSRDTGKFTVMSPLNHRAPNQAQTSAVTWKWAFTSNLGSALVGKLQTVSCFHGKEVPLTHDSVPLQSLKFTFSIFYRWSWIALYLQDPCSTPIKYCMEWLFKVRSDFKTSSWIRQLSSCHSASNFTCEGVSLEKYDMLLYIVGKKKAERVPLGTFPALLPHFMNTVGLHSDPLFEARKDHISY